MNENTNNATPEQPVSEPVQQPESVVSPAPQPVTPEQQQTVTAQQYFAQPQAAPVQYVVMAESLKGVKGWLLFFTIGFGLAGLSYISMFFAAMTDLGSASNIINLIFAPILAALAIATVVFISMEKQLGKWLAVGTLGVGAVYGVVNSIVAAVAGMNSDSIPLLMSGIVTGLILQGLIILYFFVSKRVKETLVK